MKKIGWLMGLVFIGIDSANAQVERKAANTDSINSLSKKEEKVNQSGFSKNTDKVKVLKELNLTREQKGKLKEIRLANQTKRDVIINDPALTEAQKQDQLKAIKRSTANDLQGILTVE